MNYPEVYNFWVCLYISDFFINLEKSPIVAKLVQLVTAEQCIVEQNLSKNSNNKISNMTGITKLEDAFEAGGVFASNCTLILTEGTLFEIKIIIIF